MTERKMGLFEGVLTDLKIMMDSAPFAYGPSPPNMRAFVNEDTDMSPEYLNAISGPVPLQSDDVEDVVEEYQQTLEQALERAAAVDSAEGNSPYRTLQIDEPMIQNGSSVPAISVTKLSPDLDSMTVKELNSMAKLRGVSVPAGTRRKDLIEMLKKEPKVQNFEGAESGVSQGSPLDETPLEVTL